MTKISNNNSYKRHLKKLKLAKGFRGAPSNLYKNSNQQLLKAFSNKFKSRRLRKRYFRNIWIGRINAKIRQSGFNYNSFISSSTKLINRKILSQLAIYDPQIFNLCENLIQN